MNDVLDVAHYIIRYFNVRNKPITKLKLQKLLYFVQANFIVNLGIESPCFKEQILAYPYGPVVREVLEEYVNQGRNPLQFIGNVNINRPDLVDSICEYFFNRSAEELVDLTHNQAPWKIAIKDGIGTEITLQSLSSYFGVRG